MKDRTFLKWLIVFLGVVAIVGYCLTPAFAEDEVFDPWNGIQVEDNSVVLETAPDPNDVLDDSFGQNYQFTWVPASAFVPNGNGPHYFTGAYRYRGSGSSSLLVAPVRLPSGAYLHSATLIYYDGSSSYHVYASLFRYNYWTGSENLGYCQSSDSEASGYWYCNFNPYHTIENPQSVYQLYVTLSGEGSSIRFMGVRLNWHRQIRYGLSHPFNDIGGLSAEFQASIAALYQSGITTGTSSTTFSPNNPVTRAQMAVFLARALGLHWKFPS